MAILIILWKRRKVFLGLERIVSNELTRLSSEQKKIIKETMEILQKDQLANGVTILIKSGLIHISSFFI